MVGLVTQRFRGLARQTVDQDPPRSLRRAMRMLLHSLRQVRLDRIDLRELSGAPQPEADPRRTDLWATAAEDTLVATTGSDVPTGQVHATEDGQRVSWAA